MSSNGEKIAKCNLRFAPDSFESYLTAIEDRRFYYHSGIDFKGITRAICKNLRAMKLIQGGSTITQQVARNILRDNRRCLARKLKETLFALKLENDYSKNEILELFYNNVYWGKNIYGLRAASLEYFLKEPIALSASEQIILITLLRGPNYYLSNHDTLEKRFHLISNSLRERKVISSKKFARTKKLKIELNPSNLQVYKNDCIPFIAKTINKNNLSIYSSINNTVQKEVTKYISDCHYPTSLICMHKGQVTAVGSSFGTDYPFTYRANVGSTLKPFIYNCLRENGIHKDQLFSTKCNDDLCWDIRESQAIPQDILSLKEALILSNNNVFVNAAQSIGFEKVQSYLARVFSHSVNNFVPASILGATVSGITLYELVHAYHNQLIQDPRNPIKNECIEILTQAAMQKFEENIQNTFIKTGTTNHNRERYAVVGFGKLLFGFLRQGNPIADHSKEGNLLLGIMNFLKMIRNKIYKWD